MATDMYIMFLILFVIMLAVLVVGIFILLKLKELNESTISCFQMIMKKLVKVEKNDQD